VKRRLVLEHKAHILTLSNCLLELRFRLKEGSFDLIPASRGAPRILRAYSAVVFAEGRELRSTDLEEPEWELGRASYPLCSQTLSVFGWNKEAGGSIVIEIGLAEDRPSAFIAAGFVPDDPDKAAMDAFVDPIHVDPKAGGSIAFAKGAGPVRYFGNGWYSWDNTHAAGISTGGLVREVPGDWSSKSVPSKRPGRFESAWTAALTQRKGPGAVFWAAAPSEQMVEFLTEFGRDGSISLAARCHTRGEIRSNIAGFVGSEGVEVLLTGSGCQTSLDELARSHRELAAAEWQPQPAPAGWCSWYYYYNKVTEADIVENLDLLAARKDDLPLKVIQIDDGYQQAAGDWLAENERFPKGMRWLARQIRKKGFRAGIWVAPFVVTSGSKLYKEHPDWVVKNPDGSPKVVYEKSGWNGAAYALDTTHPEAAEWLRRLFKTLVAGYGYDYLKLDFLFFGAIVGERHDQTNPIEAFRRGMCAIREAAGDETFILGCGCPLWPALGLVDGMRVGEDVGPAWGGQFSITAASRCITRNFLSGAFWHNDPDCLLVREGHNTATLLETRTLATMIAMSGGMVIASDKMYDLSEERIEIIRKLLPAVGWGARPVDLFDKRMPEQFVYAFPSETASQDYFVISVINWADEARDAPFDLEGAKIPKGVYHVFDFWDEEYLGSFDSRRSEARPVRRGAFRIGDGRLALRRVAPHASKILALRPVQKCPQLLSTTFHHTQGFKEFESVAWDKKRGKLSLRFAEIPKRPGRVFVHVPEGWALQKLATRPRLGITSEFHPKTRVLTLRVEVAPGPGALLWAEFKRQPRLKR
jgi:hypothetical protein